MRRFLRKNAAAAVRSFWRYASQEAGLQRRLSGFEVKVLAERVGLCRSRLEAIPPSLGASRGTARLTWLEIKDRAKVSSGDTVEVGRASRRACSPSRTQTWFLTQPVSAKQKAPRGGFCLAEQKIPHRKPSKDCRFSELSVWVSGLDSNCRYGYSLRTRN